MKGRSYSPSPPPRGYGRRGRSPSPRGRYGSGGSRARDRGRDRGSMTWTSTRSHGTPPSPRTTPLYMNNYRPKHWKSNTAFAMGFLFGFINYGNLIVNGFMMSPFKVPS